MYNASNNELVRTNTLVKGCIVSIDATPFKAWFEKRYSCKIGAKGEVTKEDLSKLEGVSKKQLEKLQKLQNSLQEQKEVIEQLASGKILARISSRPGQSGRADGYILEDDELAFYHRKIYDLSADTEGQFHVFYGFYNTGEVFPDDRLGAGSSCLDRSDQRGIALFLVPA